MNNIAVFTSINDRYVLMHIKDNRTEHIYVYETLAGSMKGSVINTVATDHIDNIGSTFVRYADKQTGFINKPIKGGTIVPLMYKKDPYRNKKAQFTDKLSICGEYAVVSDDETFVKASSKIPEDERGVLIDRFRDLSAGLGIGIILRTKAFDGNVDMFRIEEEIRDCAGILRSVREKAKHAGRYSILYSPPSEYVWDLLYLCDLGIEEIVTDDEKIREAIQSDHMILSKTVNITDRVGLRFYRDDLISLAGLYSFGARLDEACARKVYLKSGAYVTFEPTEALTSIDVNSSGSQIKGDRESTFLDINLEAAKEISRQLCIRNISGIIIIDFINMSSPRSYDILRECLNDLFSNDRVRCRFMGFTKLSLAEVMRERNGDLLYSNLNRRSM